MPNKTQMDASICYTQTNQPTQQNQSENANITKTTIEPTITPLECNKCRMKRIFSSLAPSNLKRSVRCAAHKMLGPGMSQFARSPVSLQHGQAHHVMFRMKYEFELLGCWTNRTLDPHSRPTKMPGGPIGLERERAGWELEAWQKNKMDLLVVETLRLANRC